jgi:hypothetical protein
VVAVVVSQSKTRPHFSGPAYIRIGSESVAASQELFEEMVTGRLEKPHEILKWKEKVVTVATKAKMPDRLRERFAFGTDFVLIPQECEVKQCTAHYVVLRDIATDRYWSAPLENVMLATDENKNSRLKLILTEKI